VDLVHRRALEPDWGRFLIISPDWQNKILGVVVQDDALLRRALTHGSHGEATYERLEFLGDRVLGLVIADELYQRYPNDPEGQLSSRFNPLVARVCCAAVGRNLGLQSHIRLGKQALEDGAFDSDNVLGDVVEALIGALYLDQGLEAARAFILKHWDGFLAGQVTTPQHPKSELQEWAAANNRRPPTYDIVDRSGPDHAPKFTVRVSLGSAGDAEGEGSSKQKAEQAAAALLLERLKS
jgi:ribonuclease III